MFYVAQWLEQPTKRSWIRDWPEASLEVVRKDILTEASKNSHKALTKLLALFKLLFKLMFKHYKIRLRYEQNNFVTPKFVWKLKNWSLKIWFLFFWELSSWSNAYHVTCFNDCIFAVVASGSHQSDEVARWEQADGRLIFEVASL